MNWKTLAFHSVVVLATCRAAHSLPITQIGSRDFGAGTLAIGFEGQWDGRDWREDVVTIAGATFAGGSIFVDGYSAPRGLALEGRTSYYDTCFGPMTVIFAEPVRQVGTWYLVRPGVGDVVMEVFDPNGVSLASVSGTLAEDAGRGLYTYPRGFLGLTSDVPITSATITVPDPYDWSQFTIDYFLFTPKAPAAQGLPVPEPAVGFLLGGGLVFLALLRRRNDPLRGQRGEHGADRI